MPMPVPSSGPDDRSAPRAYIPSGEVSYGSVATTLVTWTPASDRTNLYPSDYTSDLTSADASGQR
jgi:hypothetical protein